MEFDQVIEFWFEQHPDNWFRKDERFDRKIKLQFLTSHHRARVGELFHWRKFPLGRLAEIIILDQFSRNIFRNDPRAFLYDPIALILAQEAVALGVDKECSLEHRKSFYMPYMHSESGLIHEVAQSLFNQKGLEDSYEYECRHKEIIDRFGRYPHRNRILGRDSTEAELEFLSQPGSSF